MMEKNTCDSILEILSVPLSQVEIVGYLLQNEQVAYEEELAVKRARRRSHPLLEHIGRKNQRLPT
jgi:hypothetical protein